ncbi:hypothetical protein FQR65_LT11470 [Abscondita terminalis]|nr:hypothetical protein FQR65_LT11470 [Abscondita terminalis]
MTNKRSTLRVCLKIIFLIKYQAVLIMFIFNICTCSSNKTTMLCTHYFFFLL